MEITLSSNWAELLPRDATPQERRARWASWVRLARPAMGHTVRIWAGRQDRCCDCTHARGGWCVTQGLPCTFNPILTPRISAPGMACMGLGFTPRQLSLHLESPAQGADHA
jgi:hypothetical protein